MLDRLVLIEPKKKQKKKQKMERARHPSTSTPKMERRIIEKNRRNHMKTLYSKLYSLLPTYGSKEVLPPVPDQIDEARVYIESLQKKLEMYNEEKEKLMYGKRPYSSSCSKSTTETSKIITSKPTNVEIHDLGPNMVVVFISGLEEQASFYAIIRLLSEQGFEVVQSNFSVNGNSVLQVSYDKGGMPTAARGDSTAVSKRLKDLIINGYSREEVESKLELWDYEIGPDLLSSQLLQIMPIEEYCFRFNDTNE